MNQNASHPSSRTPTITQRLARSRYFTVSLLLHSIIVIVAGTVVLTQQQSHDDIVGGISDDGPVVTTPHENPPEERPTDNEPKKSPTPEKPTAPTPPASGLANSGITPITVAIPRITSLNPPGQTINVTVDAPSEPTHILKKLPTTMGLREYKNSDGTMNTGRWPTGRPKPPQGSEQAVMRGLAWLRDNQNQDGSWGEKNKPAMTGLALLCFLGHGETNESPTFGNAVNKAVQWMLDNGTKYQSRLSMTKDGWGPGNAGVYEHAIATYALGEYYTMTKDDRVTELLRGAVDFIVQGQGVDGGWMYKYDKTQSDTSVTGWQVQALKAASLTGLNFPGVEAALEKSLKNFDRVQGPNGGYGYRGPEDRYSLTGVGLLSELFLREKRTKDLRKSADFIMDKSEKEFPVIYQGDKADLYAWYYHTQAMLLFGGGAWSGWEKKFSNEIVRAQAMEGFWPEMKNPGHGNLQNDKNLTGKVYRTTMSVLMLEVYYRYMPVHKSEVAQPASIKLARR